MKILGTAIQLVLVFGITESLIRANAPLRRISGTVRVGIVAKSNVCERQSEQYIVQQSCAQSVTVLNGSNLHESIVQVLTKSVGAQCLKECALLCFQDNCNVAYYDSTIKVCRYTPNSAPPLAHCNHIWIIEQLGEIPSELAMDIRSFCIFCTLKRINIVYRTSSQRAAPHKAAFPPHRRISDQKLHTARTRIPKTALLKLQRKSIRSLRVRRIMPIFFSKRLKSALWEQQLTRHQKRNRQYDVRLQKLLARKEIKVMSSGNAKI